MKYFQKQKASRNGRERNVERGRIRGESDRGGETGERKGEIGRGKRRREERDSAWECSLENKRIELSEKSAASVSRPAAKA